MKKSFFKNYDEEKQFWYIVIKFVFVLLFICIALLFLINYKTQAYAN